MSDTGTLLGLAKRAGLLTAGEDACLMQIRRGKAHCIVLANDAGENAKKRFMNKAVHYQLQIVSPLSKEQLGAAIGDEQRVVIVVTDKGFARKIIESVTDNSGGEGLDKTARI